MLELNETGKIHVGEYSGPEDPYGFMDTVTLTRSEYTDMAERTYTWMDANGRSPNHVGIYVEDPRHNPIPCKEDLQTGSG